MLGPLATLRLQHVLHALLDRLLGVLARPLVVNANQESILAVPVNHHVQTARLVNSPATFQLQHVPHALLDRSLGVLAHPLAVNANQESIPAVQVNHHVQTARLENPTATFQLPHVSHALLDRSLGVLARPPALIVIQESIALAPVDLHASAVIVENLATRHPPRHAASAHLDNFLG